MPIFKYTFSHLGILSDMFVKIELFTYIYSLSVTTYLLNVMYFSSCCVQLCSIINWNAKTLKFNLLRMHFQDVVLDRYCWK